MTIEILNQYGADTTEGLARCMNNEEFYLKMVMLGLSDERFETLGPVLQAQKLEEAFEMCHALKGVFGNLALTPLYDAVSEMTELLRARKEMDYLPLYNEIKAQRDQLLAMEKEQEDNTRGET